MEIEIDIESMHCEHCAANIERYLRDQPGVGAAEVDYEAGGGWITADEDVDIETLVETIDAMGYQASIRESG